MQEIPLLAGAANAQQAFTVQLGTNLLRFELHYISYTDTPAWSLDIFRDGTALVLGAMLESGCDIIANCRADIGSLVFVGDNPTLDNLGINNSLVYVEQP
jgi:hypothetical protein